MRLVCNGKVLANNVVVYQNFLLRSWGLRFSKPIIDKALILVSPYEGIYNSSIDMFFVFFPIDVLWLNSNFEIVDFKTNIKPFTVKKPKAPAKYVVELRAGSIKNLLVGNKVSLIK